MTKQSNFEDVLFSLPERAARTWLAQKALRGVKVATPSFNWIPLSSTCWLQADFYIWITLLAIRSWRAWMAPDGRHWYRRA